MIAQVFVEQGGIHVSCLRCGAELQHFANDMLVRDVQQWLAERGASLCPECKRKGAG